MSFIFSEPCLGLGLTMMFRFLDGAFLSGHRGERVHMQSVGEERKEYRRLFLRLVQCGTGG
jgi:hypothetical protein